MGAVAGLAQPLGLSPVLAGGAVAAPLALLASRWMLTQRASAAALARTRPLADTEPFELGVRIAGRATAFRGGDGRPLYVPRDVDRLLTDRLSEASHVVLVGPPSAGKTRTALEMLRQLPREHRLHGGLLVEPRQGDIEALLELPVWALHWDGRRLAPAVLWLDDISAAIRDRVLTQETLDALEARYPATVLVGTLRSDDLARLEFTVAQDPGQAETARILQRLTDAQYSITVSAGMSSQEIERARRLGMPVADMGAGIGHWCVAVDLLRRKLAVMSAEGRALVAATLDWQIIGASEGVPRAVLRALLPEYLARDTVGTTHRRAVSDERFAAALDEATEPVIADSALLVPTAAAEATYRAPEPLEADHVAQTRGSIPELLWDKAALCGFGDAESAMRIATHAAELGAVGVSEGLLRGVIRSGAPSVTPSAELLLGQTLASAAGREQEAESILERLAAAADVDVSTRAQFALGTLLVQSKHRVLDGESLLRAAATSGDATVAGKALLTLGVHLARPGGRAGEAAAAFEEVIRVGDPEEAAWAAVYLGDTLCFGHALEHAADHGGLVTLSDVEAHVTTGNVGKAGIRAYRRAMKGGYPAAAGDAAMHLSLYLFARDRSAEAVSLLKTLSADDRSPHCSAAGLTVGTALMTRDPADAEAEEHLRKALRAEEGEIKWDAALALAHNIAARVGGVGELTTDETSDERAWRSSSFAHGALRKGTETDEALQLLNYVIDATDGGTTPKHRELGERARRSLAIDLIALGEPDEAVPVLQEGFKRNDPVAGLTLAELMLEREDEGAAAKWWRRVLKMSPKTHYGQEAAFRLAHVLLDEDSKEARRLLARAAKGPDSDLALSAQVVLDRIQRQRRL